MIDWLDLKKSKKFRTAMTIIFIILSIIFVTFGGGKLLVYVGMFISGLLIGWNINKFKSLYDDYKLALKVNSIQFSSKKMIEMQKENEKLKQELSSAAERISIYQSSTKINRGGYSNDDFNSNRFTGIRENAETL